MACRFLNIGHRFNSHFENLIERSTKYINNKTNVSTITFLRVEELQIKICDKLVKLFVVCHNSGLDMLI